MPLYERVGNLHIHTLASDGTGDVSDIAAAASRAGLDFCLVTDHNACVYEEEGWHDRVLVLVGQEVHDPGNAQRNHLLVFGVHDDLTAHSGDPGKLISRVRERGGLAFLAHPFEQSGAYSREPVIQWTDWTVSGFTGIEAWNYMSEFKSHVSDPISALLFALWPKLAISGPYPETLRKWDDLLGAGDMPIVGGSDAHAMTYTMGPIKRRVFSYDHLFRTVNTHILVPEQWSDDSERDGTMVYEALRQGRSFVCYDSLAPATGFRFAAEHGESEYTMGDRIAGPGRALLSVSVPRKAFLRIIQNGFCVAETIGTHLRLSTDSPGAYRVEVYRRYMHKARTWILSNPIYIASQPRGSSSDPAERARKDR